MTKRKGEGDVVVVSIVLCVESCVESCNPQRFTSEAFISVEHALNPYKTDVAWGITLAKMLVELTCGRGRGSLDGLKVLRDAVTERHFSLTDIQVATGAHRDINEMASSASDSRKNRIGIMRG